MRRGRRVKTTKSLGHAAEPFHKPLGQPTRWQKSLIASAVCASFFEFQTKVIDGGYCTADNSCVCM